MTVEKVKLHKLKTFLSLLFLTIGLANGFALCSSASSNDTVADIADKVWAYSQTHAGGFTLDLRTMTEPSEGIAVSYAATQNSHSRSRLDAVVSHALHHDGYVGGWLNTADSLYYFDSTRLFPEGEIGSAVRFGRDNSQHSLFIISTSTEVPLSGCVADIVERGTLRVGTTGDYRPLSFRETDGTYWGFCIEVARAIARRLGVGIEFVATSWPSLTADVTAEPPMLDLAIGGITITDARRATMLMSDGYLANGKTILCRAADAGRFRSLADINKPGVCVMVNPGGLNEKFAADSLPLATIKVHARNEEIPSLIAEGQADVMITEITEAPYYVQTDSRLAAPLLTSPFTHGEIGVLMPKANADLLQVVNSIVRSMKADGSLLQLHRKYGLNYGY